MLVGCGAKEGSDKSPSQVAVKVNKGEISVHQVNDLLSRAGNIPEDQIGKARSAVVERLIEQELLMQQAMSHKLDRNPNVMQMIEFSRREILARAYGEQIASGATRPTDADVSKFYDENPVLFSKRRIYSLQEINLRVAPERFDEVRTHLQSGGSLQQLATWFNEQKIPFVVNAGTKPAEQLPPELAKHLSQLNANQATLLRTPMGALLIFVVAVQEEPVDRVKAKPIIENILFAQARGESLRAELKHLREAASVNYVGDFSPPEPAAAESPASAEQEPVVQPDAPAEDSVQSILEKGDIKLK
jgi:EpsD family peptidyl-prolyl cis-trans isomerase